MLTDERKNRIAIDMGKNLKKKKKRKFENYGQMETFLTC